VFTKARLEEEAQQFNTTFSEETEGRHKQRVLKYHSFVYKVPGNSREGNGSPKHVHGSKKERF